MSRINEYTDLGTIAEVMELSGALRGKKICITGHLGRPRQDIIKIIKLAGAEYHSSVKFDTSHLLTNKDWTNTEISSKFSKARKQGVRLISEKEFYDILCS